VIVRSFLKWFENAPVEERIEAARGMTQAYVAGHLGSDSREDAEAALTLILDDPSMQVRRALAWELAACESAPRHIIVALAHDQPEVAALVLARSPLLREADLIDCAANGTVLTQTAIALRPLVPARVSAVLAATAEPAALISLLRNPGGEIAAASFAAMIERYPGEASLREALNERSDLPATVRHAVMRGVSADLMAFAAGWMPPQKAERAIRETQEIATVGLAAEADDLGEMVDYLCRAGHLTPGLLLRSLLCGEVALFGAALTRLGGLNARRVAGMLTARNQGALSAACLKAGLPRTYLPAFLAAVSAVRDMGTASGETPRLNRLVIQRVLVACLEQGEAEMNQLLALLRRYDAQAAREDARLATAQIMLAEAPVTLDSVERPDVPDFSALEQALDDDPDRPFTEAELRESGSSIVDLERFGEDLVLQADDLVEPALAAQSDADGAFVADFDADFDALVQSAFHEQNLSGVSSANNSAGREPLPARTVEPLRVIESQAQHLDESYFNSWELRRSVA